MSTECLKTGLRLEEEAKDKKGWEGKRGRRRECYCVGVSNRVRGGGLGFQQIPTAGTLSSSSSSSFDGKNENQGAENQSLPFPLPLSLSPFPPVGPLPLP